MMSRRFTVRLERDPETGDIILPIPPEVLHHLGLEVGDSVVFEVRGDTIEMRKANTT